MSQRNIEKMSIEFKINGGVEDGKKTGNSLPPHHFVRGPHVSERAVAEVFDFK